MNIKKKISFVLIITFFITCMFTNFINATSSTAYDIGEYIIEATVKKDGNLHVVEKIEFDFFESANGIYRDILYKYEYLNQKNDLSPTSSRYQATNILNIYVCETDNKYETINKYEFIDENEATNGMKSVFSLNDFKNDGYVKRVKMYIPSSSDDKKYFKIEYDIEDVAVLYEDKGEIYWNFVGKGWDCYISDLEININFEGNSNEVIKFFPHGYTKIKNITNVNERLSFEVPSLSPRTAVDARIVFSDEYLNKEEVVKIVNESYDFKELEKIEKGMEMGKTRYNLSNIIYYIIIGLVIIYLVLLIIKSSKILSKGKNKKPEYYTEPLDNLELAKYAKLNGGIVINSNLIMATILDLKHKKVLDMVSQKKLKKSFDGVEYDYYLTINEEADLTNLSSYEILILEYLFNGNVRVDTLLLNDSISEFKEVKIELNKRFKELSIDYKNISFFNKICQKYDEKISNEVLDETDKGLKKFSLTFFIVIAILTLFNNFIISPLNINLKCENLLMHIIFGIILAIFAVALTYVRGIKEKYYDDYNKLKGLEKYLKEYSLIKDRYPIEIALWDRYLVFATLFGIAKKVAKEFKEELIKNGYDEDYIYSNYPIVCMSMYSSQMSSYIASSTGSSSSGGYSGSGSGGGGRRRRRRPEEAAEEVHFS